MERHRPIEFLRSASWAVLLLSALTLIANNDPRPRRSIASLTPPSTQPSDDSAAPVEDRQEQAPLDAVARPGGSAMIMNADLIADPVMPLSMSAIDLPWTPLQRYRFYCPDDRRYYPDVTRCRVHWQAALTIYQ